MLYGSQRFEGATSNNTNRIVIRDVDAMKKIVIGKDVTLVLPEDPERMLPSVGYPTHQESWLPMWFILQYHSKSENAIETEYRRKLAEMVKPEQRAQVRGALLKKAQEFMDDFRTCTGGPKKKFKKFTRILQDILLYSDVQPEVIEDHDVYLDQSIYKNLIELANALRRGERMEEAQRMIQEVEEIIARKVKAEGGQERVNEFWKELQGQLTQEGKIFVITEPEVDSEMYIDLCCYDLLMSEDAHDVDVVSITDRVKEPEFYQIPLFDGRRMDTITVPPSLGLWDTARKKAKESYQPISFIVMTHTTPVSGEGKRMQDRLQTLISPREVAEHYLGAAKEFFDGEGLGKSWRLRKDNQKVSRIKKSIPLHRIARDLLPRAIYMLKTGEFPSGVENDVLFEQGETLELAQKIEQIFLTQDASLEELDEIAEGTRLILERWYKPEYTERYEKNMEIMKQHREIREAQEVLSETEHVTKHN